MNRRLKGVVAGATAGMAIDGMRRSQNPVVRLLGWLFTLALFGFCLYLTFAVAIPSLSKNKNASATPDYRTPPWDRSNPTQPMPAAQGIDDAPVRVPTPNWTPTPNPRR